MLEGSGRDSEFPPDEFPQWSAAQEERARILRQRINQSRTRSNEKSDSSRTPSTAEVDTTSEMRANGRVFTDYDVLAEIASEKEQFLLAIQNRLHKRGCNFATLGYIRSVIKSRGELVIDALCARASSSYGTSSCGSLHSTFDDPEKKDVSRDKLATLPQIGNKTTADAILESRSSENDGIIVSSAPIAVQLVSDTRSQEPEFDASRASPREDSQSDSSTTSNGSNSNATVIEARDVSPEQKNADTLTYYVPGLNTENFDDPAFKRPGTTYFQSYLPESASIISVTVVEFNTPDNIVVQRQDLSYNCAKISRSIAAWINDNPDYWESFKCHPETSGMGTPVIFNTDDEWRRGIIINDNIKDTRNIRLIDDGTLHLQIPLDCLCRISAAHASLSPLISKISLDLDNITKSASHDALNSMRELCLMEWKEATFECSGTVNSCNYVIGDLIANGTGRSLKKELAAYGAVVDNNMRRPEVVAKIEKQFTSFTLPRIKESAKQRKEGMGFSLFHKTISGDIGKRDEKNASSLGSAGFSAVAEPKTENPSKPKPKFFPFVTKKTT